MRAAFIHDGNFNGEKVRHTLEKIFTLHMFQEEDYERYGIRITYHFWKRNEFTLPDGTGTDEPGANEYIRKADPEFYYTVTDYMLTAPVMA